MSKLIQTSKSLSPSDKLALIKKRQKIRGVKAVFEDSLSTYHRKQLRIIEKLSETTDKRQIEKIKKQIGL